jgi:hypothetical protein
MNVELFDKMYSEIYGDGLKIEPFGCGGRSKADNVLIPEGKNNKVSEDGKPEMNEQEPQPEPQHEPLFPVQYTCVDNSGCAITDIGELAEQLVSGPDAHERDLILCSKHNPEMKKLIDTGEVVEGETTLLECCDKNNPEMQKTSEIFQRKHSSQLGKIIKDKTGKWTEMMMCDCSGTPTEIETCEKTYCKDMTPINFTNYDYCKNMIGYKMMDQSSINFIKMKKINDRVASMTFPEKRMPDCPIHKCGEPLPAKENISIEENISVEEGSIIEKMKKNKYLYGGGILYYICCCCQVIILLIIVIFYFN